MGDSRQTALDFGSRVFPLDASCIDPDLPVPIGVQVRGLLVYLLTHGDLPAGTRLPSVRELAQNLNIAVMTVNQVYKHLAQIGMIEIRRGLGAYTLGRSGAKSFNTLPLIAMRSEIDRLLSKAARYGISSADLMAMISAQAKLRPGMPLRIAIVGPFLSVVPGYVESIRPFLSEGDEVSMYGIDQLSADPGARVACASCDLVVVNANRRQDLVALMGETKPIVSLRLNISEKTAEWLRHLPADTRLLMVAGEDVYASTFRPAILKMAPHLRDVRVSSLQQPNFRDSMKDRDALLYAGGAESVIQLAAPGLDTFEYIYEPDLKDVEALLVPALVEARRSKQSALASANTRENSSAWEEIESLR